MGGKGGGAPAMPVMPTSSVTQDNTSLMESMAQMMEGMSQMIANTPQLPVIPEPPSPVDTGGPIDWAVEQEKLAAKTRAEYTTQTAKDKGRVDTIHTSPLLDEPEVTDQELLGMSTLVSS